MKNVKQEILRLENISKEYSSFSDLFNINLNLFRGEIHCVLRRSVGFQNTLCDLLSGSISQDYGNLYVDDIPFRFSSPHDAMNAGIYTITRRSRLVPGMSIAENIFVVREGRSLVELVSNRSIEEETKKLLDQFHLSHLFKPRMRVSKFNSAKRHLIEILKAVHLGAKVLVIDNTIMQYSENEISFFVQFLRQVAETGVSILLFINKYWDFLDFADRLTIIRNGTTVAHIDDKPFHEDHITTILAGNPVQNLESIPIPHSREIVLRIRNLFDGQYLRNLNFELFRGEVLGILDTNGFVGPALADILFSQSPCYGEVTICGKTYELHNTCVPRLQVGLIPEGEDLTFQNLSLYDNITLNIPRELAKPFYATDTRINQYLYRDTLQLIHSSHLIEQYGSLKRLPVLGKEEQMRIQTAKWLFAKVKILVMINPAIYFDATNINVLKQLLSDVCNAGVSMIIISANVSSLLDVCSRVVEVEDGSISSSNFHYNE